MASRTVLGRDRVAQAIVETARIHAQEVGTRLQEVFAPAVAEGEPAPDFVVLLQQVARFLEKRIDRMVEAENLHFQELDDDLEPRRRRDATALAVRETLLGLRGMVGGVFGSDFGDKVLGIDGTTPDDPRSLYRLGNQVLERLNEDTLALPPRRLNGFALDLGSMAEELQPRVEDLAEALDEVGEQARRKEATLRERDLALGALDAAVGSIGRLVIALDLLAGFPEYAERIRLKLPSRRRSGTSSPDETSQPEGGEDGGETPDSSEEPPAAPPDGPVEIAGASGPPEVIPGPAELS